jgi:hypothetical protein
LLPIALVDSAIDVASSAVLASAVTLALGGHVIASSTAP